MARWLRKGKTLNRRVLSYFLLQSIAGVGVEGDEVMKNGEMKAMVGQTASNEKIGLIGPMLPGVLFAVYDSQMGVPEYIPPEYIDIQMSLEKLVEYVDITDDHPLIFADVVHY